MILNIKLLCKAKKQQQQQDQVNVEAKYIRRLKLNASENRTRSSIKWDDGEVAIVIKIDIESMNLY